MWGRKDNGDAISYRRFHSYDDPDLRLLTDSVMLVTPGEGAQPEVRAITIEMEEGPSIDVSSPKNGATLTDRVRKYVTGTKLGVPGAEFPARNRRGLYR